MNDTCQPQPQLAADELSALLAARSRAGVAQAIREAREAAGLSPADLAGTLGTSVAAINKLESDDNELFSAYSIAEARLIAETLGVRLNGLLSCGACEVLGGNAMIALIKERFPSPPHRELTLDNGVSWRIDELTVSAEQLFSDLTLEALQWLCAKLELDWRKVVAGW